MQARPGLDIEGRERFADQRGVGLADLAELVGRVVGNDDAASARVDGVRAKGLLEAGQVHVGGLVGDRVAARGGEGGFPVPVANVTAQPGHHAVALIGVALAEVVGAHVLQQVLQADHATHQCLQLGRGVVVLVVRAQVRIQELVDRGAGVAREPAGRVAGGGAVGARRATVGGQVDVGVGRLGEGFGAVADQEVRVDVGSVALGLGAGVDLVVHPRLPDTARAGRFAGEHVVAARRGFLHAAAGDRIEREVAARIELARLAAGAQAQVGQVVGVVDVVLVGPLVVEIAQRNRIAPVQVHRGIDVVAVFIQVAEAGGDAALVLTVGADPRGSVGGEVDLRALVGTLGDHVDHTGHRIGTVHRRRAVGQHFHAFDRRGGDRIDVDELGLEAGRRSVVGQAATVQQHQRALCAEATQVGLRGAVRAGEQGTRVLLARPRGGQVVEHLQQRACAHVLDVLLADHLHRRGGFHITAADVGAGHLDARQFGGFRTRRCVLGAGTADHRNGQAECDGQGGGGDAAMAMAFGQHLWLLVRSAAWGWRWMGVFGQTSPVPRPSGRRRETGESGGSKGGSVTATRCWRYRPPVRSGRHWPSCHRPARGDRPAPRACAGSAAAGRARPAPV